MATPILLVEELQPTECNIVQESSNDSKNMWLNGICMQSSIKNRNGRNYPLAEITAAVANAKQRITESGGIFGELEPVYVTALVDVASSTAGHTNLNTALE